MTKLSVTIITLNEEKYIKKCIDSIKEIADEIILVDSGSNDKTVPIARSLGAKVFVRKFDNYANQKNFALGKASGEWVFSIDADEVIEKELADEIKAAINSDQYDAYSAPRKNIILGQFIRYTRWQPELDRHIWLFKKKNGKWVGNVHEEVEVEGRVGKLRFAKVHFQYETVKDFLGMVERYSTIEADEKFKNGQKFSLINLTFQPIYNFLVRYVYRLGFLDGWRGLVLSYLMAFYHTKVQLKLLKLQR